MIADRDHTIADRDRAIAPSPFGARGELPLDLSLPDAETARIAARSIPGVVRAKGRGRVVHASYDATVALAREGWIAAPIQPAWKPTADLFPGARLVHDLGIRDAMRKRAFQWPAALWLGAHDYAIEADPMRVGKTLITIAAVLLRAPIARKIVFAPAFAAPVWAREIWRWTKQEPLILYGRRSAKARYWRPGVKGSRYLRGADAIAALRTAQWVICSGDLLIAHRAKTDRGVAFVRPDLPGWSAEIFRCGEGAPFAAVIFDEAHLTIRTWKPDETGDTRRLQMLFATAHCPIAYAVTGTPFFGYTRDIGGILDVISRGCWSGPKPFNFHARYCDGHHESLEIFDRDQGGKRSIKFWSANGSSHEDELRDRLSLLMLKRERAELAPDMPPKTRCAIIYEDLRVKAAHTAARCETDSRALMGETFGLKCNRIVEHAINDAITGEKVIVFVAYHAHRRRFEEALTKALRSRKWSGAGKRSKLRIWSISGHQSPEARLEIADEIIAHSGAAIVCATIDSLQGAVSLRGVTLVHYGDVHHNPYKMFQSEERSYEVGADKLSITYHLVPESYDDRAAAIVIPKLKRGQKIWGDMNAAATEATLRSEADRRTLSEIAESFAAAVDLSFVSEPE